MRILITVAAVAVICGCATTREKTPVPPDATRTLTGAGAEAGEGSVLVEHATSRPRPVRRPDVSLDGWRRRTCGEVVIEAPPGVTGYHVGGLSRVVEPLNSPIVSWRGLIRVCQPCDPQTPRATTVTLEWRDGSIGDLTIPFIACNPEETEK